MAQGNDVTMTKWSLWAGITFIILLALLHVIKPDIEPSWNFISEYQVGHFGWLMSLAFVSLALSCSVLVDRSLERGKPCGKDWNRNDLTFISRNVYRCYL